MSQIFFETTEKARTFTDEEAEFLLNHTYYGIMVIAAIDTPNCYDSWFEVKEVPSDKQRDKVNAGMTKNLVIHGGVAECGFGKVEISLPLEKASQYYYFLIEVKKSSKVDEVKRIIEDAGYKITQS